MRTPPARPAAALHTAPAVPDTGQAVRRWWRAARIWFVLAALLVLVALPSILRQDPGARPLGTDSARPEGGRAVARVLDQHGIAVHPAASLPEALALAADHPGAPVLFHDPAGHLPAEALEQLAEAVGPERRVLVEPGLTVLQGLAPGVSQGGVVPEGAPLPAGQQCRWPAALEARSVSAGGRSYRTGPSGQQCFPVPGTGAGPSGAAYAVVTTAEGTVVLGHRDMVANAGAADEGHAVLSLWTLGRDTDVIWYLPSLADVPVDGGPPTLDRLLPDWVRPAGLWLVLCLFVLLLWRGRRHGPLAVEPLPVIVPASETAVGRARLYERSGQYAAAARALRSATVVRLASALRLGPAAPVGAVVAAASRASGLDAGRVGSALDVDDVGSGRALVAAAAALQDLEDEVHRGLQATGTARDGTSATTDTAAAAADTPSDADPRTP
ncbi:MULTISPECIES: DUF4350 domain-containing protein [Citricoccus]|uniref:DUF4350 domain-containing protein n=1 Tax=Citricoccus TaxID=169133 RepID=UPI000255F415|nr:DUF4350 domain-containing protein [Citricoccus sp. CH26A]